MYLPVNAVFVKKNTDHGYPAVYALSQRVHFTARERNDISPVRFNVTIEASDSPGR